MGGMAAARDEVLSSSVPQRPLSAREAHLRVLDRRVESSVFTRERRSVCSLDDVDRTCALHTNGVSPQSVGGLTVVHPVGSQAMPTDAAKDSST